MTIDENKNVILTGPDLSSASAPDVEVHVCALHESRGGNNISMVALSKPLCDLLRVFTVFYGSRVLFQHWETGFPDHVLISDREVAAHRTAVIDNLLHRLTDSDEVFREVSLDVRDMLVDDADSFIKDAKNVVEFLVDREGSVKAIQRIENAIADAGCF